MQRRRLGPSPRDDEMIIYTQRTLARSWGSVARGSVLKGRPFRRIVSRWYSKRYLSASRLTMMASEQPESTATLLLGYGRALKC